MTPTRLAGFVLLAASVALSGASVRAAELADPTAPPRAALATGGARTPSVSAILIASGRRIAIVDGRAVGAGDRIGPITIEAVLDDGVRYTRGGRRAFAPLPRQPGVSRGANP